MRIFFAPGSVALVLGLGASCTIGYGTILYSFSLLSLEIENAFGWSSEFVFGVYSIGILFSGLLAAQVGRRLDRSGARWPMSVGSIVVAISLLGLANMNSKLEYVVYMLVLEGVSILVLYESAFVALTQRVGKEARRSISQITLIAGFASTIFWPVISNLLTYADWRTVYVVMAGLHLFLCFPIHWAVLRSSSTPSLHRDRTSCLDQKKELRLNVHVELLMGIAFGLAAFCIVGIQIHLFSVFNQLGLSEKLAILAGTLIGPCQVFSRAADMLLSRYVSAPKLANISLVAMALGLLFALSISFFSPYAALLFTACFGIGQGLTNIVRGALPLYYFGELNYGSITGRMNRIRLFLTAISPVCFAFLLESYGATFVLALTCILCLSCIALLRRADRTYKGLEGSVIQVDVS